MAPVVTQNFPTKPVQVSPASPNTPVTATLLVSVIVVLALYFGRDVFEPLALAVLLSFALAPIVRKLQRWGLPKLPAVIGVVLLAFLIILGFGTLVATQLVDLAGNLPKYEQNIVQRVRGLHDTAPGGGIVQQVTGMVRDLSRELSGPDQNRGGQTGLAPEGGQAPKPVPVEVHEPMPSPLRMIEDFAGPVLSPLATFGIVVVFTIFMLLQREDLRDRLIRLAGSGDLHRTTTAMNDAAKRLSRYLLMQLTINTMFGAVIGFGLWMIGIPNPLLFGLLAGALRFVPFIGSFIAAAFPIALSLAVAPGWTMPLLTAGLFVILEPIVANVVEPWLYGSSTGLSPLAILVAAIFWTTLWGPVGLLLATPLTVCLVVLGRYVPPLHFLDVLLGDRPVLPPEAKLYQRMLAHDPDEAIQIIHEFNKDEPKPLVEIYDGLVLKALMLAEQDRQRGGLDDRAQENILEVVGEIIEAWSDYADPPPEGEEAGEQAVLPERRIAAILSQKTAVLCIGARNDIDEAAAELLIHLVRRRGIIAGTLSCEAVNIRNIGHLDRDGVNLICLSYLAPNMIHAGRLARRLHGHFGDHVGIMIGFWGATAHDGDAEGVRGLDKVGIVTTLGDACAAIVKDMAPLVQAETAR